MVKHLQLSKDVALPVDAITERIAVVGQSGSGKTYAAMRLAELMLEATAQVVVLDPMGVWWGLLSTADGGKSGFKVHVFGGEHAHVPIVPEAGGLVAEVIVEKQISAVIDVSHMTRSEQVQFAIGFAERFFKLQVKVKRPVHLFVEEAQTFMPQKLPPEGSGGDPRKNPAVLLNRMELLVRQGRSQGIGCSMITQAPQAVAKSCLNQAGTLLAMRTIGTHERKAISDWMADKATDDAQLKLDELLPKLGTGEAWIASPHFLGLFKHTRVSKKTTYDSSATPKFGVKLEPPKVLAEVDVEALREAMKTVVETVEKDDPAPLRRRIAELERQLREVSGRYTEAAERAQAAAKRVEVPVLGRDVSDLMLKLDKSLRDVMAKYPSEVGSASPAPAPRPPAARPHYGDAFPERRRGYAVPIPREIITGSPIVPTMKLNPDAPTLKKGARVMLGELAALHPRSLTRAELATRAVISHKTGTFSDYLSALRSAGLVEDDHNGDLRATAAGVAAAAGATAAPSSALIGAWSGKFKKGARTMLELLVQKYPGGGMSREELAEAAGLSGKTGTFSDYLSALRSSGCVEQLGKTFVVGHALYLAE